jgi:hypothetical protein
MAVHHSILSVLEGNKGLHLVELEIFSETILSNRWPAEAKCLLKALQMSVCYGTRGCLNLLGALRKWIFVVFIVVDLTTFQNLAGFPPLTDKQCQHTY